MYMNTECLEVMHANRHPFVGEHPVGDHAAMLKSRIWGAMAFLSEGKFNWSVHGGESSGMIKAGAEVT